jgi:ATP-dependent DNA ligase
MFLFFAGDRKRVCAFDLLWLNGKDLRGLPIEEQKSREVAANGRLAEALLRAIEERREPPDGSVE